MAFVDATVVVTVEAYPHASATRETVCVAGIRTDTATPHWIRIWPYPLRDLPENRRFRTWDVVQVPIQRSSDSRPESHTCNPDQIQILGHLEPGDWVDRRRVVDPLILPSMCAFLRDRRSAGDKRSLAAVRVDTVDGFEIDPIPASQLEERRRKSAAHEAQASLLASGKAALEPMPYRFRYVWSCDSEPNCPGHRYPVITYEIGTTFRNYRRVYGSVTTALEKMTDVFMSKCVPSRDVALFVGNMQRYPDNWLTLGIYSPPRSSRAALDQQTLPGLGR